MRRNSPIFFSGLISLLLSALVGVTGCAHSPSQENPNWELTPGIQDNQVMGPEEPFGPALPPTSTDVPTDYGPTPNKSKGIVLVLGPGLARGYAFSGALRALEEAKIPILAIYGVEMGAVMGALYALTASGNEFEWALQKLKDESFLPSAGLLSAFQNKISDGEDFKNAIEQILGRKDLREARIPLRIVVESETNQNPIIMSDGEAPEVLRSAIAVSGFMAPGDINGRPYLAANQVLPYPIQDAKASMLGPVVVIDVLEGAGFKKEAKPERRQIINDLMLSKKIGDQVLGAADLVIRPNLTGISPFDFKKRSILSFRGKSSVHAHLKELKQLVAQ